MSPLESPWDSLTELGRRREREEARLKRQGPRKAGELIGNLLQQRGYINERQADILDRAWQSVLRKVDGAAVAAGRSRPGRIRRGVLEVWVVHAAIHQELSFCKAQIVEHLGVEAADLQIREVRFRVSPQLDGAQQDRRRHQ
jgi:hypothetical protein